MQGTMLKIFEDGGWIMWALLVLSIAALAVGAERWLVLSRARRQTQRFLEGFERVLADGCRVEDLLRVSSQSEGPVARVALAGLRRFKGTVAQVEATLERHGTREVRQLSRRLGILSTIAMAAPLLGFLGTVTGMIFSFEMLGAFGQTNPAAVADGIAEALVTTAGGLIVALPTQVAYNALLGWSHRLEGDIEAVANTLLELKA